MPTLQQNVARTTSTQSHLPLRRLHTFSHLSFLATRSSSPASSTARFLPLRPPVPHLSTGSVIRHLLPLAATNHHSVATSPQIRLHCVEHHQTSSTSHERATLLTSAAPESFNIQPTESPAASAQPPGNVQQPRLYRTDRHKTQPTRSGSNWSHRPCRFSTVLYCR